ncbi:MAG TPA: fucose isomerase, partial [Candidatus Sumerlaeota bacterium]|nr:fucose isomerase [Candidatus Sumerlaeota bacterium]
MPRKIKVGVLTFGDGRDFLQKPLTPVNEKFLGELKARLLRDGFDVITGREVVWQNEIAVREGRRMTAEGADCVLFNFSVWAWPQYARMAA